MYFDRNVPSIFARVKRWLGDLLRQLTSLSDYLNPKPLQPAPLTPEEQAEADRITAAEQDFGKLAMMGISRQIEEAMFGENYPGKGALVGSYLYDASVDQVIFLPFHYSLLQPGDIVAKQFVFLGYVGDFK